MKRALLWFIALTMLFSLAGCSHTDENTPTPPVNPGPVSPAPVVPGSTVQVTADVYGKPFDDVDRTTFVTKITLTNNGSTLVSFSQGEIALVPTEGDPHRVRTEWHGPDDGPMTLAPGETKQLEEHELIYRRLESKTPVYLSLLAKNGEQAVIGPVFAKLDKPLELGEEKAVKYTLTAGTPPTPKKQTSPPVGNP